MLNREELEMDANNNVKVSKRKPGRPKSPMRKAEAHSDN